MEISTANINYNGITMSIKFRDESHSDKYVIQHIFQNQDYDIKHWAQGHKLIEYHQNHSKERPSLIIDAGANIGASTVYFSNIFAHSRVFSIEPDIMNWNLLQINTSHNENIFNYHGALSNTDGKVSLIDPGRSDWGFMTEPINILNSINVPTVDSISPNSILSHPMTKNTTPLIFKIDIEGGEEFLFKGDTSWMNLFPLIIIELHDWMLPFSGSSANFLKAVGNFNFDLVHRGENIFLFNREILSA
jgi:FkbM family methyltransferase